jgi:hypothetical protein
VALNLQRFYVALALAGVSGLAATPAQAAWDNVFQPACNCRPAQTSRYYTPPVVAGYTPVVAQYGPAPVVANAPPASDCQQCTTRYVQRSYYQPVTTMESRSYYEKVTSYQASSYYEPVTSYRIAYYPDSCGCGYKQVAVPQTSYSLKTQYSPVDNWVQRCTQVPVTTQQLAYYLEPQTTCTQTTVGAPIPMPAPSCPAPSCAPSAPAQSYSPPPQQPMAAPQGPIGSQAVPSYYFAPTNNTSAPPLAAPTPPQFVAPERIAAANTDVVHGQVTRRDGSPKSGTQILFVSASSKQVAQTVANDNGRFNVSLPTGNYYIYFASRESGPAYQGQVQIRPNQPNDLTLVNR